MIEPVFIEVLKVKDGVFIDPQPHIERIFRTTQHFFAQPLLMKLTDYMIPQDMRNGLVKCRIVYGEAIHSIDFEKYTMRTIKSLRIIENDLIDYKYKYLDREVINNLMAQRNGCDDILIVKNSLITDTSFTNVVFEDSNKKLFTPTSTLLSGTKRQKLLETGIIEEKEIKVNDIKQYKGVYLINAMIDIEDNLFIDIDSIQ
jgi:4-amino-4-deoxychorismate lyase